MCDANSYVGSVISQAIGDRDAAIGLVVVPRAWLPFVLEALVDRRIVLALLDKNMTTVYQG